MGAAGNAHHEREVRDQAVVHPEDDGPQRAADAGAVATFGTGDAAPCRDPLHRRDRAARGGLLLGHGVGGLGFVAIAIRLGRLGAEHQGEHRLGAEVTGEEAQRLHAERHAGPLRLHAGLAQEARPVLGVTLLSVRELEEHAAPLVVGVFGETAEQGAARELVGVHLLDALEPLGVQGGSRHDVTVATS